MTALFANNLQEELDELAARVEDLSWRLSALWGQVTGSTATAQLPRDAGAGRKELLGASLESLVRRAGYQLASGASIETVLRAAVETVERATGRKLERWLTEAAGGGVLGGFFGAAGLALFDLGLGALESALRKRRLELPAVEERPFGSFPAFARRESLFPLGTERADSLERQLAHSLARALAEER